jgi:hypothetical protein
VALAAIGTDDTTDTGDTTGSGSRGGDSGGATCWGTTEDSIGFDIARVAPAPLSPLPGLPLLTPFESAYTCGTNPSCGARGGRVSAMSPSALSPLQAWVKSGPIVVTPLPMLCGMVSGGCTPSDRASLLLLCS